MEFKNLHPWDVSPKEAIKIQKNLLSKLIKQKQFSNLNKVAGVDVGFQGNSAKAAVVVLSYPALNPLDQSLAELPVGFPYIPGLLAFREGPAVIEAFKRLKTEPDLIIFDAQGYAHPRRMGLASHLGIILDKPSIGCAKTRLVGYPKKELANGCGAYEHLFDGEELVGAILRTKANAEPLYISIGHKIDLETASAFVKSCTIKGRRLPETTIYAHEVAGGKKLKIESSQQTLQL